MPKRDATVCISQTVMLAKQEGRTQTIQVHDTTTTTLDILYNDCLRSAARNAAAQRVYL
jgi:hypothetical protein